MNGRVYLIGAGCGEADLITVRGLSRLSACDVVVYDDLIDRELLDAAPAHAEQIYMGKGPLQNRKKEKIGCPRG